MLLLDSMIQLLLGVGEAFTLCAHLIFPGLNFVVSLGQ